MRTRFGTSLLLVKIRISYLYSPVPLFAALQSGLDKIAAAI
jgi:hypothetical protein